MPDIVSSDVSYVEDESGRGFDSGCKISRIQEVSFGDGVLTYPAGGVPLDLGQMGFQSLDSLHFLDSGNANGFVYKYDRANKKIRIYQGDNDNAGDAPLIELVGGVATPAAAVIVVELKGR